MSTTTNYGLIKNELYKAQRELKEWNQATPFMMSKVERHHYLMAQLALTYRTRLITH